MSAPHPQGYERHDDLNQLIGGRVIGELDILPNDLFCDLLWKDKRKYVDHQLDRFLPLVGFVREVHHRPRVTVHSKRKSSTANPFRLLCGGRPRPQGRKQRQTREQNTTVDHVGPSSSDVATGLQGLLDSKSPIQGPLVPSPKRSESP